MHDVLNSERFKNLIRKRWTFSFIMLVILFVIYYGYVFLIALDKDFIAQKVTANGTVGIYLTIGVIVSAWLLTIIYVIWANKVYDPEVEELKKML